MDDVPDRAVLSPTGETWQQRSFDQHAGCIVAELRDIIDCEQLRCRHLRLPLLEDFSDFQPEAGHNFAAVEFA